MSIKDFWSKNKKWMMIALGIVIVIAVILMILKARKDHIGTAWWVAQITKLKSYLTVTDYDNWSFDNLPEGMADMEEWANTNYPNLREANETMDQWLDRQVQYAYSKEPWLAKLLF